MSTYEQITTIITIEGIFITLLSSLRYYNSRCLLTLTILIMVKNILFTGSNPFIPQHGGVERVTDSLCKELLKRGFNVFYLCKNTLTAKDYIYPCPISFLPNKDFVNSIVNLEFYHDFLRKNNIDIVINQDGLHEGAHLFCNRSEMNVKIISVIHNNPITNYNHLFFELFRKKNNSFEETLRRYIRIALYPEVKYRIRKGMKKHYEFLFKNSDQIVILAPSYFPLLKKINKGFIKKTCAIYNPNTYEEQQTVPPKENRVLYVGRLHKQKRIERLLYIWKSISNGFPDWYLDIVGDGEERAFLQNICLLNNIRSVTFWGNQDPKRFYQKCSIICIVSDFEGFPMVLTEAMQYGCVPISFDSFEAIHDIIIPHTTGEIIKPFKKKKYALTLKNLMQDIQYREYLSRNAFKQVKKFDIKPIVNKWELLFRSLE